MTRQGETILVQIPGVEDQQRAIDLVGQTAELRFRPVLGQATFDDEAAFNAATAAIAAGDLDGAALVEAQAIVDRWTLTPVLPPRSLRSCRSATTRPSRVESGWVRCRPCSSPRCPVSA